MTCLHIETLAEARAAEAAHGSAGGGFPCGTCQQPCTTKANELLEVTHFVAGKSAAVVPLCDCEEGPVTVHCGKCNVSACDDCDAGAHLKGARKAHVRIPIKEHLGGVGGAESGGGKALMCPIHKDYPLIFFCKQASILT